MEELTTRQLIRIASRIVDQLHRRQAHRYAEVRRKINDVITGLQPLKSLERQLDIAGSRNWKAAIISLINNVDSAVRDLPYLIEEAQNSAKSARPANISFGEVLAELKQAKQEFSSLKYDAQGMLLSVITDPIELEDVYLGEFQVQLDLQRLGDPTIRGSIYRVIAQDPHPAAANSSVTHPHVSDERLCEGDASASIRAALAEGRICDFFMLVRAVLTHYNPDSPYVALSDWNGIACHECGYVVGDDDRYFCESCNHDFCQECISSCRRCDEIMCMSCLDKCPVCDDRVCSSCMTACGNCGELLCRKCLEERQCSCNQEEQEDQHDHDHDKDSIQTPGRAA